MLFHVLKNRGYDTQQLSRIFLIIGSVSFVLGIISNRLATRGMGWDWLNGLELKVSLLDFSAGFFLSIAIIFLITHMVFRFLDRNN